MDTKIEIAADSGLVGCWDAAEPPAFPERAQSDEPLHASARDGKLFFVCADDPVRYRIHVLIDEQPAPDLQPHLENSTGSFRLELPSGKLVVSALQKNSPLPVTISTSPGSYVLTVFRRAAFDSVLYRRAMEELVGAADWRYSGRITNLGAIGCLAVVLAVVLLLIPKTRAYWQWIITIFLAPSVLYHVMTRLPRYRRIEEVRKEHEARLPHYVFHLKRSESAREISGGWFREPQGD